MIDGAEEEEKIEGKKKKGKQYSEGPNSSGGETRGTKYPQGIRRSAFLGRSSVEPDHVMQALVTLRGPLCAGPMTSKWPKFSYIHYHARWQSIATFREKRGRGGHVREKRHGEKISLPSLVLFTLVVVKV
jgi:hypothetical protein